MLSSEWTSVRNINPREGRVRETGRWWRTLERPSRVNATRTRSFPIRGGAMRSQVTCNRASDYIRQRE